MKVKKKKVLTIANTELLALPEKHKDPYSQFLIFGIFSDLWKVNYTDLLYRYDKVNDLDSDDLTNFKL